MLYFFLQKLFFFLFVFLLVILSYYLYFFFSIFFYVTEFSENSILFNFSCRGKTFLTLAIDLPYLRQLYFFDLFSFLSWMLSFFSLSIFHVSVFYLFASVYACLYVVFYAGLLKLIPKVVHSIEFVLCLLCC